MDTICQSMSMLKNNFLSIYKVRLENLNFVTMFCICRSWTAINTIFFSLSGEAESGLERLHQCAEKELQQYLNADGPSKEFNDFKTKLAGLTRYMLIWMLLATTTICYTISSNAHLPFSSDYGLIVFYMAPSSFTLLCGMFWSWKGYYGMVNQIKNFPIPWWSVCNWNWRFDKSLFDLQFWTREID